MLSEEEKKKHPGWGGARIGAGRKAENGVKKTHSFYLTDNEYNLVKQFISYLRSDKFQAKIKNKVEKTFDKQEIKQ